MAESIPDKQDAPGRLRMTVGAKVPPPAWRRVD